MRDINVITRHNIANYGSLLQSYATIVFFRECGFEAKIIDYVNPDEKLFKNIFFYSKKRNLKGMKFIAYYFFKIPDEYIKMKRFEKFRKKYLNMTIRFHSSKKLNDYFHNTILCSGGDQLWGRLPNGKLDQNYFLEFSDKTNEKISFASSIGNYDLETYEITNICQALKKYSAITVREDSAKIFLKNNCDIEACVTLDPTLLVSKSTWNEFIDFKRNNKNYVLVYQLRDDSILDREVKKYASQKNMEIIRISTSIYDFLNSKILKSPPKVLNYFRNADCIFTDSFHATIFSLIFEKEFYAHIPPNTGIRILNLLDKLNLSNRYFYDCIDKYNSIDYIEVNNKIENFKLESIELINNILERFKND